MAIKYFSEISGTSTNLETALNKIPDDAALLLNFNNDDSFYEIFKDYELFDAIVGEKRAREIKQLQELLLLQPELSEATSDKNIFISFHPNRADSVDFLYSININNQLDIKDVEKLLLSRPNLAAKKNPETNLFTLTPKSLSRPFYLYLDKGAATGSFSEKLLLNSLDVNQPKLPKEFIDEIISTTSGHQNSPVNLFINHNKVPAFIAKFLRGKASGNSALLTNIRGLSSLNMNFKSDALMFNGISKPDTTAPNYLDIYLSQKPVVNELKKILPAQTSNFIAFGISNYLAFKKKLNQYFIYRKEFTKLQEQIKLIQEETGVNVEKELNPLWGNEFAVIETANRENLAIIKVKNGRTLNFSLQLISNPVNSTISQINHSHLFYYYFGDPLNRFPRPFYAVADNYLIISNTPGVVQNYLKDYESKKFLITTPEFTEYNQFVANRSNIFYFINNPNSERVFRTALKNNYSAAFNNKDYDLKNFYGFSYQWSSDAGHFFTNIYINYVAKNTKDAEEAWNLELNSKLAIAPQVINNGDQQYILIQDNSNTLYAVSLKGEKVWSSNLAGKVLGQFKQINDGTILFNTQKKLYRIKSDGSTVTGFPVNLPFNASYSLSYADDNLFVPAGNLIMGFDKEGKPLENWNKSLNGKILFDIKTATIQNVKYVIAGTERGTFYFYNQNGTLIGEIKEEMPSSYKNPLYLDIQGNLQNSKVLTTDTSGTVISVSFKGIIHREKITEVHGDHFFDYKNVAGDDKPEYIFLDNKSLNVLRSDATPVFTYNFPDHAKARMLYFPLNNYKVQAGISDGANKQWYLFNEDGNIDRGFPVKGDGQFLVLKDPNNGNRYLIGSKKRNSLSAYKL